MRLLLMIAGLLAMVVIGGQSQASMPNLPPSATILLDCAFNSITCSGAVVNSYQAGQIIQDGSALESPPNIYRYSRAGNAVQGGTQLDFFHSNYTEIYIGLHIRTSPIWRGLDSGSNKIVMAGNNVNNFTLALYGSKGPQGGSGSFQLMWNDQNSGQLNNCHYAQNFLGGGTVANGPLVYGDCPGGLNWFPNAGSGAFSIGPWHYVEWCGKASTSFTSRNGIYKWFLDGALVGNYPNVNTASFYNASYVTPTWDGQGTPWGADAWWDVDRWVVASLPAGTCASLGGGTAPNPPPPPPVDTTPPGRVTGLTITQLN